MRRWSPDATRRARPGRLPILLLAGSVLLAARAVRAEEPSSSFSARQGVAIVTEAATAWHPDAYLVYLENDEPLDPAGNAARWGYLFYSPSADEARGYSVRSGEIVHAGNVGVQFKAPPLPREWVDSAAALASAEDKAGREYRETYSGHLDTILLMRGAFQEKAPDTTTWTLIYTSPQATSLFVVVDAASGKVKRTWRG